MRVEFLGTGTSQGVPMIGCHCKVCLSNDPHDKRLRSSVAITEGDTTIIIDCGPDFRYQMLRSGIENIDAILFTHPHKDHTGGIDDVRAYNYTLNRPMDIYSERSTIDNIKRDYSYIFAEYKYPGVPEITPHIITNEPFSINGINITPIRGLHHKMGVLGFRLNDFCYITDMNYIPKGELAKIKGSKVLVITALRCEPHISHFALSEAIEVANEAEINRVYFTHISHQLGLYSVINETLPKGMQLAYDTLIIDI